MSLTMWIFGALLSLAALLASAIMFRAFRAELRLLRPAQGPIERPADAEALALRDVVLATSDGSVHGWLSPSRNGAAILFVHGSPSDRTGLLPEARALARAGYGTLLLDIPGHGESVGVATWGKSARSAIRAGVSELLAQPGVHAVGAYGFSMGSSVVTSAAATDARIEAVVLSGVFTNIRAQLDVEFARWGPLSQLPARWAAKFGGLAMDELVPTAEVAALTPRPLLVIAGADDHLVPLSMSRTVYEAAGEPKELLVVPGAGHGDYAAVLGQPYLDTLRRFYDHALLGRTSATRR
jgi:pimeloyl-ACP methyl ester carboxylesterase